MERKRWKENLSAKIGFENKINQDVKAHEEQKKYL